MAADRSPTGSTLAYLQGGASGERYAADRVAGPDPADGRPLLARYDLRRAARTLTRDQLRLRRGGMWRWAELLPVRRRDHVVHLGEGGTPLLAAPRLGARLGLPELALKAEGLNPTGSFKARGMAAAVSRATELGVRSFVVPSAGNAAGALAAYAAAAGAAALALMPADAPPANQAEVLVAGGQLVLVDGLISDCGRLAGALAQRLGALDVARSRSPTGSRARRPWAWSWRRTAAGSSRTWSCTPRAAGPAWSACGRHSPSSRRSG